jgi:hypothetical protein
VKLVPRLVAYLRGDVEQEDLVALQSAGGEAYALVEGLPRGPARLAAWNAYVLQTYGDKLMAASRTSTYVRTDTAALAEESFRVACRWLDRANSLAADPGALSSATPAEPLPHWHTAIRCGEQLVGMRETLIALHAYVAYDLNGSAADSTRLRDALAKIDGQLETVDILWIKRPPAEIRGGIGTALCRGLDETYALGQALAVYSG